MSIFRETTHLSEIIEESSKHPVIVFIFSSECGTSTRLAEEIERSVKHKKITAPIYKVTVQLHPALSERIESWFGIKHESPQILILKNGSVTYTAHHGAIRVEDFIYE